MNDLDEMRTLAPAHGVNWYDLELRNRQSGGHFFTPEAMRFFRSRRCGYPLVSKDRRVVACVTSEHFEMSTGERPYPRRYTVRVFWWGTGLFIREPWGFQAFGTSKTAQKRAGEFVAAWDALAQPLDKAGAWDWIRSEFPEVRP